jgi:hypothetical protein
MRWRLCLVERNHVPAKLAAAPNRGTRRDASIEATPSP